MLTFENPSRESKVEKNEIYLNGQHPQAEDFNKNYANDYDEVPRSL